MHSRRSLSRFALALVLATLLPSVVMCQKEGMALQPAVSQNAVAQTVDGQKAEADRLLQQGIQQDQTSQFEAALQSWQQALSIYRIIKDPKGEANALNNLGTAYHSLGNYTKAIEYHEQSLAIAREIKHRPGEAHALGNLGSTYHRLGNYAKAIEYHEQSFSRSQIHSRDGK